MVLCSRARRSIHRPYSRAAAALREYSPSMVGGAGLIVPFDTAASAPPCRYTVDGQPRGCDTWSLTPGFRARSGVEEVPLIAEHPTQRRKLAVHESPVPVVPGADVLGSVPLFDLPHPFVDLGCQVL